MIPGCRRLVRGDLSAATGLFNEAIDAGELTTDVAHRTDEQLAAWLLTPASQFESYVVDRGGGPIAWASLTRYHPREAYGRTAELSLYVTPAERRRGLGLALGRHMVERARSLPFHLLVMLVFADAPAAMKVGKALSFSEVGSLRGVYPRGDGWLDVTLCQLQLASSPEVRA